MEVSSLLQLRMISISENGMDARFSLLLVGWPGEFVVEKW